jgi:hypothetical protein
VAREAELKNEREQEDVEVGVAWNFHDVKFQPPMWERKEACIQLGWAAIVDSSLAGPIDVPRRW